MLQAESHIALGDPAQARQGRFRIRQDAAVALGQPFEGIPANLVQDFALIGEMHVERRRGQAYLIGDLADRGAVVAAFDKDAFGRRQDLGPAFVPVSLGLAVRSRRGSRGDRQSTGSLNEGPESRREVNSTNPSSQTQALGYQ